MAWYLQRESFFRSQANKYITRELRSEKTLVVDSEIVYAFKNSKIKITLLGEPISEDELGILKAKAKLYSLSPETIEILQSTFSESLEKKIREKLSTSASVSTELQIKLKQNEVELSNFKNLNTLSKKVSEEMTVVFPKAASVFVINQTSKKNENSLELKVLVHWRSIPTKSDLMRASEFLSKRLSVDMDNILHLKGI
jgi:hypothetical protein